MNDKLFGTEPAFPVEYEVDSLFNKKYREVKRGLTQRAFAAIMLRVPDSGEEWIDNMIRTSIRLQHPSIALMEEMVENMIQKGKINKEGGAQQ